ncbi:hypothetical protein F9862_10870 [Glaesserella parasuis]|nr:hypothetical protein [Glaesserella parasuis]MWQ83671.1 hypothetical protein [Glaesserella parasuis]
MKRAFTILLLASIPSANANWFSQKLPNCDQVNDVLQQIFTEQTQETGLDLTLEKVSYIKEVTYKDQDKNTRFCSAIMQTKVYKLDVIYSISPADNGNYWVQIEDGRPILDAESLTKGKNQLANNAAEEQLKSFELAKKYGNMSEACTALRVAKQFF